MRQCDQAGVRGRARHHRDHPGDRQHDARGVRAGRDGRSHETDDRGPGERGGGDGLAVVQQQETDGVSGRGGQGRRQHQPRRKVEQDGEPGSAERGPREQGQQQEWVESDPCGVRKGRVGDPRHGQQAERCHHQHGDAVRQPGQPGLDVHAQDVQRPRDQREAGDEEQDRRDEPRLVGRGDQVEGLHERDDRQVQTRGEASDQRDDRERVDVTAQEPCAYCLSGRGGRERCGDLGGVTSAQCREGAARRSDCQRGRPGPVVAGSGQHRLDLELQIGGGHSLGKVADEGLELVQMIGVDVQTRRPCRLRPRLPTPLDGDDHRAQRDQRGHPVAPEGCSRPLHRTLDPVAARPLAQECRSDGDHCACDVVQRLLGGVGRGRLSCHGVSLAVAVRASSWHGCRRRRRHLRLCRDSDHSRAGGPPVVRHSCLTCGGVSGMPCRGSYGGPAWDGWPRDLTQVTGDPDPTNASTRARDGT